MVATITEKVTTTKYTDCHCHLIPGMDDGPAVVQEAVDISRILYDFGFSEVICTPHLLKGSYDHQPERVQNAVTNLQTILYEIGIPLKLRPSIEYYLDEYLLSSLEKPLPLQEGVILVEAHQHVQPRLLIEICYRIMVHKKLRPLLAHPERCELSEEELIGKRSTALQAFLRSTRNLLSRHSECQNYVSLKPEGVMGSLREIGCLFQGNIGSFAGIYGEPVRKRATRLLQMGFYDRLGTDAHRPHNLAAWLEEGLTVIKQIVGREELTRLLRPLEVPVS